MTTLTLVVPGAGEAPPQADQLDSRPGQVAGRVRLVSAPPGVASAEALIFDLRSTDGGPSAWVPRSERVTFVAGAPAVDVGAPGESPRYPADGRQIVTSAAVVPEFEPNETLMAVRYGRDWRRIQDQITVANQRVDPAAWLRERVTEPIGSRRVHAVWLTLPDAPAGSYTFEVGS